MNCRRRSARAGVMTGAAVAVAPGEVVGSSGASGAGKPRLLRAVADLDVHGGDIRLDGRDRQSMRAHAWRRRVTLLRISSCRRHARRSHLRTDAVGFPAPGLPIRH
ncbi:ATP-binding cassette domain-containing protein [Spiribacter halobius]|uniref:ABC transporter domain-containing protein n=1 Tax=Sediminicurvatus halobius TaxID=2182432 RepID=A0A2U2MXS0_9GAMM|nr:hypothetical protein DEM34_15635 [Spiribacter halobius]